MEKTKKEEKNAKDQKRAQEEQEVLSKVEELEKQFSEVKTRKETLSSSFPQIIDETLDLWSKKIKSENISDKLYLLTAKLVDLNLLDKSLRSLDNLTNERKTNLNRFFFTTFERFSSKRDCGNIKPSKIFATQQKLISNNGKGNLARALFSIQK